MSYFTDPDNRSIAVRRWMIDATRDDDGDANLAAALMLAQITWWMSTSDQTGKVRAGHEHAGEQWLVRSDKEWGPELGLSERGARRIRTRLVKLGLIECKTMVDNGVRGSHIRRVWLPSDSRPETAVAPGGATQGGGGSNSKRPETANHPPDQAVTHAGASRSPKRSSSEVPPSPSVPKPTDDPVTARAHKLATLAHEQPVKPITRGGFLAVRDRIRDALVASYTVGDIERAILAGPITWTADGLTTAIAKSRPRGNNRADAQMDATQRAHERAQARDRERTG